MCLANTRLSFQLLDEANGYGVTIERPCLVEIPRVGGGRGLTLPRRQCMTGS